MVLCHVGDNFYKVVVAVLAGLYDGFFQTFLQEILVFTDDVGEAAKTSAIYSTLTEERMESALTRRLSNLSQKRKERAT